MTMKMMTIALATVFAQGDWHTTPGHVSPVLQFALPPILNAIVVIRRMMLMMIDDYDEDDDDDVDDDDDDTNKCYGCIHRVIGTLQNQDTFSQAFSCPFSS